MSKRTHQPTHRRTGAELGTDGKTFLVKLLCTACNRSEQEEPFSTRESFAKQARECECLWCGRVGAMRQKMVA